MAPKTTEEMISDMHADIAVLMERTKGMTCQTHVKAIEALEKSDSAQWKAIGGKASWAAIAVVLGVFGTVLVIAVRA